MNGSRWVIQFNDGGAPTDWTDSRQYTPQGHWTEKEHAKRFESKEAAQDYIENTLFHQQELCTIVPQ